MFSCKSLGYITMLSASVLQVASSFAMYDNAHCGVPLTCTPNYHDCTSSVYLNFSECSFSCQPSSTPHHYNTGLSQYSTLVDTVMVPLCAMGSSLCVSLYRRVKASERVRNLVVSGIAGTFIGMQCYAFVDPLLNNPQYMSSLSADARQNLETHMANLALGCKAIGLVAGCVLSLAMK